MIAQELAETLDRAFLQRALVELAVLDEPSGDAARAAQGSGAGKRDQTAAELVQLLVGSGRVLQDAGDIGIDRGLGPRAGDDHRHAEALEIGLAALALEARDHLRLDAELECLGRQVDVARPRHPHQRTGEMQVARLRLTFGDHEARPERREIGLLRAALLPAGQNASGQAAHRLGDVHAADGAVGEFEFRRPVQRRNHGALARAARREVDGNCACPLDALEARRVFEEAIGVELRKRQPQGLLWGSTACVHAQARVAGAVVELEVGKLGVELAPGKRGLDPDRAGRDGAGDQLPERELELGVDGPERREVDLRIAPA